MKTSCLVFMTIACAVLMYGTSYGAPSDPVSQQSSSASSSDTASDRPRAERTDPAEARNHKAGEKPSHEQPGNRHVSDKNRPPSQAGVPKASGPSQPPKGHERSTSGDAMNLHQPGPDKSVGAAKGGLLQNEAGNNPLRVRPSSVVRPAAPSLDNVRHRSPNPAVVSGSANATTRNTGAINGALVKRKP